MSVMTGIHFFIREPLRFHAKLRMNLKGSEALYYELYLDSLFCSDFIMNFYMLSLTERICGHSATRPRRLLGAAYGAGIYCLTFLLHGGWLPGKIVILAIFSAVGMERIVFGSKSFSGMFKRIFTMAGAAFFQGGIFIFLKNQFPSLFGEWSTILSTLVIGSVAYGAGCFVLDKNRKRNQVCCCVNLQNGQEKITVKAFVDTGNFLVEPISGKPVSIMDEDVLLKLFGGHFPEYYRVVPFCSIGKKKGILRCFEVPKMSVEYQDETRSYENTFIACNTEFKAKDGCPMILNPRLIMNQEEK